jgi:TDG/mug DNA glycosylase family protein
MRAGVEPLRRLLGAWRPVTVAFLGISTYRIAFDRPTATVGPQPAESATLDGAQVWVLPNPSGLNAHYQQPDLTRAYAAMRGTTGPRGPGG